ncbi:MAG: hypothetical protein WB780_09065 [Candidatus Acidiferrales bacterium]
MATEELSRGKTVKATVRITFEDKSKSPALFEKTVEFSDLRDPGGDEFVAQYLLATVEMESRWGKYRLSMPDVSHFHRSVNQSFGLADLASPVYEDRINTRAIWVEIAHTLLRVKSLLSKSRAFHDVQRLIPGGSEAENVVWHLHLDKMENFDLGSILLGKVSELTARLIFERLGASLIPKLDRSKPDWERNVTWRRILKGFADRTGNPNVASLSDSEYQEVQEILAKFLDIENGKRLLDYEHKLVHRITPSVDNPRFYTHLESRAWTPIIDEQTGQPKGREKSFGTMRSTAEYSFLELFEDGVQTLRHYVDLLGRLDAIPRFGPEAVANAAKP